MVRRRVWVPVMQNVQQSRNEHFLKFSRSWWSALIYSTAMAYGQPVKVVSRPFESNEKV